MYSDKYMLRVRTLDISFGELSYMEKDKEINIFPNYKSNLEWSQRAKSKYVESALLGLPLDNFIFEESEDAIFNVVDGSQRLNAFLSFFNNEYRLTTLSTLSHYNNKYFYDLEYSEQLRLRRAVFNINVIDRESHPFLKSEYIKRKNINNVNFVCQQARNYAYPKANEELLFLKNRFYKEFTFVSSEKSYGKRRFKSELRELQFFLVIITICYVYKKPNFISSKLLLENLYDEVTHMLDFREYKIDLDFIDEVIVDALSELEVDSVNLVLRKFTSSISKNSDEISMNDFLIIIFNNLFNGYDKNRFNIDFFRENTPIKRLERYL